METRRRKAEQSELEYWQYWCQLTFQSVDVHVDAAWVLAEARDKERLKALAADLDGPVVHCFFDIEALLGRDAWQDALQSDLSDVDWTSAEFNVGTLQIAHDPQRQGIYCLACRVALGRATTAGLGEAPAFPEFFSSCLMRHGGEGTAAAAGGSEAAAPGPPGSWSQVYRVKSSEQVLPVALCQVIFEIRPGDNPPIMCEYQNCNRPARLYCRNDNAHFCLQCDSLHHSANPFFSRHQRFDMAHSPFLFGFCTHHPDRRHETACMQCKALLCSLCNKTGSHAREAYSHHTLISTTQAFCEAMQGSSESDKKLEARRAALQEVLLERRVQLTEVEASLADAQHQMDILLRGVLDQLTQATSRKVEVLQSSKRQLSSEVLFLLWLESFQNHAKLALPPADFILAARRHQHLLLALFGSRTEGAMESAFGAQALPPWVEEDLRVDGTLSVQLATTPPPLSPPPVRGPPAVQPLVPRGRQDLPSLPPGEGSPSALPADLADGGTYKEATPRSRAPAPRRHAGAAGVSDTLYVATTPREELPRQGQQQPEAVGLEIGTDGWDSYISRAEAYLREAEARAPFSRPALDAPADAGGNHASGGNHPSEDWQLLAADVLSQLRAPSAGSANPSSSCGFSWGCALVLLSDCPTSERNELMLRMLHVAQKFGHTSEELAQAIIKDDVHSTQVPSLLASANGLPASLVHAMLSVLRRPSRAQGHGQFLETELLLLVQQAEGAPAPANPQVPSDAMHSAVKSFLSSLVKLTESSDSTWPKCLVALCHHLYVAAEVKFGPYAAQNAVATMLVSRVVTPSVLRTAQGVAEKKRAGTTAAPGKLSDRISELSRLLQRVAHFTHHEDDVRGGRTEAKVLENVNVLKEVAAQILQLQPSPGLGLEGVTPKDTAEASAWIIDACRRWAAGLPMGGGAAAAAPAAPKQRFADAAVRMSKLGKKDGGGSAF